MLRLSTVFMVIAITFGQSSQAGMLSPFLEGPYLQELSSHGVVLKMEVDPPGPVTVHIEPAGGDAGVNDAGTRDETQSPSSMHSVRIEGLSPKTSYRYSVVGNGAKAEGSFTTAPPDGDKAPITFLIYGDNRTDALKHSLVVRAMQNEASDFLVHTGDFVDSGANAASWQSFFDVESQLLKNKCVFATVGNHELTEAQAPSFLRYFGSEKAERNHVLNETVRWGMAQFFFLNGWGTMANGVDREWLERVLTESDRDANIVWRFLVVHHGPYSSSLHGPNERFQEGDVEAMLLKHQIDLVISGHDHVYERGANGRLRYVVSGGGGAPLYPVGAPLPQTRKALSDYHYVRVSLTASQVSLVAKRPDATQIEAVSFSKTGPVWSGETDRDVAAIPSKSATNPPLVPTEKSSERCHCSTLGNQTNDRQPRTSIYAIGLAFLLFLTRRIFHGVKQRRGVTV